MVSAEDMLLWNTIFSKSNHTHRTRLYELHLCIDNTLALEKKWDAYLIIGKCPQTKAQRDAEFSFSRKSYDVVSLCVEVLVCIVMLQSSSSLSGAGGAVGRCWSRRREHASAAETWIIDPHVSSSNRTAETCSVWRGSEWGGLHMMLSLSGSTILFSQRRPWNVKKINCNSWK